MFRIANRSIRSPAPAALRGAATAVLLLAPAAAPAAGYYGSGWYREAEAELRYDDNLGRTGNVVDRKEDFSARFGAGIGYEALPAADSRFGIAGRAAVERFDEYHDLDNIEIGAEGWYTFQPRPGPARPWYEAWGRISRIEHRDSDIRDGGIFEAGTLAGMRFGEAVSGRLGYVHSSRWGDDDVFDVRTHAVELDMDADILPRATLYGGYTFQWGDLVSTARSAPGLIAESDAVAIDDAFGGGTGSGCGSRRCAWRLEGRTHFIAGGVQWQVTGGLYLDLSARWFRVRWGESGRYEGLNYRASLYFRF
jgi:hypothetical protein